MKVAKENAKSMRPMFPRVHVSDTEKGGPRAPPRNKMALYEQLSIPSQKHSSATLSPNSTGSVTPASSIQGATHERAAYFPINLPNSTITRSAEKHYSNSSNGKSINKGMNLEISTYQMDNRTSLSTAMNYLKSKRDDDNDDFKVPILAQLKGSPQSNDVPLVEVRKSLSFDKINTQNSTTLDSFIYVGGSLRIPIHEVSASEMLTRKRKRAHTEKEPRGTFSSKEHGDRESTQMHSHPPKKFSAPSNPRTQTRLKLLDKREPRVSGTRNELSQNCSVELQFLENSKAFKMRNLSCVGDAFEFSLKSSDGKVNRSEELQDAEISDEGSDMSMVDSISDLDISPDDVVGVIGPKQFLKARRAIVNQQRVFAIQVFELHRLIKVQKLFAASPHLLLDDCHMIAIQPKSLLASSMKHQQKHHSEHDNSQNACFPAEEALPSPLQVQMETYPNKVLHDLHQNAPPTASIPTVPTASDDRPNPWCFSPPVNQWLIPVMSPSEGLIFKPYSGPCPPSAGFMPSLYGVCRPSTIPHVADFMNSANGADKHAHKLPVSPLRNSDFPPSPYGMPIMNSNTLIPVSANPLNKAKPNGQTLQHSKRSFCNISNHPTKKNASKDCWTRTSTASSLNDRACGALPHPLFASTYSEGSYQHSQSGGIKTPTNVIKVVPHNGRSATESAARIFRSIQRERQQLDY